MSKIRRAIEIFCEDGVMPPYGFMVTPEEIKYMEKHHPLFILDQYKSELITEIEGKKREEDCGNCGGCMEREQCEGTTYNNALDDVISLIRKE